MRIKKFKINNYKSICEMNPCWLSNDITIFAGKNESGKTATLEALRDFDPSIVKIPESAESIRNDEDKSPSIKIWFDLTDYDLDSLFEGLSILKYKDCINYIEKNGFPLVKTLSGNYILGNEIAQLISKNKNLENKDNFERLKVYLAKLQKINVIYTEVPEYSIDKNLVELRDTINKITNDDIENQTSEIKELCEKITENINNIIRKNDNNNIITNIKEWLPKFIFFDSFNNELPYEVPLDQIEKFPALIDFIKVAGIDLKKIRATEDTQKRANLLSGKSAQITGDFATYWQQDKIELTAKTSGDKFILCIKEKGQNNEFKAVQRSKGFQWFLSFYLRLKSENILTGDSESIILIDEPGLYLHATAQKDVLDVLESLAKDSTQILFSTHSPYLLDSERFDRIRLVTKDNKLGSKIENKAHNGCDRDTLTPLITSAGLYPAKENQFIKNHNVLLEGIADYYFLVAMKKYLNDDHNLNEVGFIPCKGASQIHYIASILIGWGLDFVSLLDNDTAGRSAEKDLNKLDISKERIIFVKNDKNAEIEDLFSQEDFQKYILSEELAQEDEKRTNSKIVKDDCDKVLLAKLFMDKINSAEKFELSQETKDNFISTFQAIENYFFSTNTKKQKLVANDCPP